MSEFFEYKFITIDTFYKYVCKENLSYGQAGGRCLVDFSILLAENSAKTLAIYGTVLSNIAKYMDTLENFMDEYEKLIIICKQIPIDTILDVNEKEYFQDDLDFIKYKFKQL